MDTFLLDSGGFIQRFIEWIINYGGLYILLLIVFRVYTNKFHYIL